MPTLDEHSREWARTTPARFPLGTNLKRPWCYDHPAFEPRGGGQWMFQQGYSETMSKLLFIHRRKASRWRWNGLRWELASSTKPRMRWRRWFSKNRCAAWDCGPDQTPAPVLDRYDCRGCYHMPPRAKQHFNPRGERE